MMLAIDKKGEEPDAVTKAWIDANQATWEHVDQGRRLTLRDGSRTGRCRHAVRLRKASSLLESAANDRVRCPQRPRQACVPEACGKLRSA